MSAWQPMETAPLDGTSVLVWNPMTGVYQTHFQNGEWPLFWWGYEGRWYPTPYAWMPLPAPPSTISPNAEEAAA